MRLVRRVIKVLRHNGPWQAVKTASAVAEDRLFDWRYGVDTSGKVPLEELAIDSRNVARGVWYQPTRAGYFRSMLRALSLPPDSVFVDYGAGKGRMLLLAARSGRFRKVVGVEFSADLCRIAERNVRHFERRCGDQVRFEVVHADAADFEVEPDQNVFFMYNPFDHVVMQQVVERITRSLEAVPRRGWLVYLNVREECVSVLTNGGFAQADTIRSGTSSASVFVR